MLLISLFILGLFAGSFLGVLISRLHSGEKGIFFGRSHCEYCKYQLTQIDLIPVLSWVILRGRCRKCKKPISIKHPLIEILTGLLWLSVGLFAPFISWYYLIWLLLVVNILWFTTLYDLEYQEIPLTLWFLGLSFAPAFFASTIFPVPFIDNALLGASIGLAFFLIQIPLKYIYKQEVVGVGDLYLAVFMGAVLGWQHILIALFMAYLSGSLMVPIIMLLTKKGLRSYVPFGPFLALGAYISLFWGSEILSFWNGLFI